MNDNVQPAQKPSCAALLDDLTEWHVSIARGDTTPLGETPARIILARVIDAITDTRRGAVVLFEAAIGELEAGRPDHALTLLKYFAAQFRDKPNGSIN